LSAALSTALSPAHHPPVRRLVVVLLGALFATGLLAMPASATIPTTLRSPASQSVYAGRPAVVRSKLLTAADQPVAGRRVQVLVRYPSGSWRYNRTTTTNSYGTATIRMTIKSTRYVMFRFLGDQAYAASTSGAGKVTVRRAGGAVVTEASRHRGKPYGYGATGPSRFDCSGFTLYVYRRFGRSLPHSSGRQRARTRWIPKASRRPGDLVFFHGSGGGVYHVGIYAGHGYMWDSPRAGKRVSRRPIFSARVSYGRA
jgi:cell wall-associated NlpC family hydrolase